MDHITIRSKMRVFEKPGERVLCIMSSGNLSLSQATLGLIDDDIHLAAGDGERPHLMNQQTLSETARYVASKVRAVQQRDRTALEADGAACNSHMVVRGSAAGAAAELHLM